MVNLEEFFLSSEQIAALRKHKKAPKREKPLWCKFDYWDQLEMARETRCAAIAVHAELYRLWYRAYDKAQPISLSNSIFQKLGFARSDKIKALKILIKLGKIRVEWRHRKSPLVTVIRF